MAASKEIAKDDAVSGKVLERGESWDELVERGKACGKTINGAQWEYGDLACAVETHYGESSLKGYAENIGVAYSSLREYRRVSRAYPQNDARASFSYAAARVFANEEDRLDLLASQSWTDREARAIVKERKELEASKDDPAPLSPDELPEGVEACPTETWEKTSRQLEQLLANYVRETPKEEATNLAEMFRKMADKLERKAKRK